VVVSTEAVKELRERTGAGVMDCKRALEEASGNMDRAAEILRQSGLALAEAKAHRVTMQGLVECYIHAGGRIGAMVELNCETDFVARTDSFKVLAHDLAMQVAAMGPLAISSDDLPPGAEGEPSEMCLLLQPFIRDPSRTIQDLITEAIAQTRENIQVRRFARFELGQ
jgi:elongation factor Ts